MNIWPSCGESGGQVGLVHLGNKAIKKDGGIQKTLGLSARSKETLTWVSFTQSRLGEMDPCQWDSL